MTARSLEALTLISEAREAGATGRGRRVREAAGLTQQEIAGVLCRQRSTVGMYEANLRRPAGRTALTYGRLLRQLERRAMTGGEHAEREPASG